VEQPQMTQMPGLLELGLELASGVLTGPD